MLPNLPVLHTKRLQLMILDKSAAAKVADYYRRNRAFHQPWFAERSDQVFTAHQQELNLDRELNDFHEGRAVPFWLFLKSDPDRIIGRLAFMSIVRGCFDSCFLAYHLDQDCVGSGLALEAGEAAIPIMFRDFRLHRIEANIMPVNQRSIALAERLGFHLEGMARQYLKINGQWEDHLHYVRLADAGHRTQIAPDQMQVDIWPRLESPNLVLRLLETADLQTCVEYFSRNRDYLQAWNPLPADDLVSLAGCQRLIAGSRRDYLAGRRLLFGLFLKDQPSRLAGLVDFSAISPLPYSSCMIGFAIDRLLSGRSLMLEALSEAIPYAFIRFGLKRINAECCENNDRSRRLLELIGFVHEGLSRQAIFIGERWQNVEQLALLREDFRPFSTGHA